MVQQGLFREDLYYRINVFPVHLPSLSERAEDIPLIAHSLLAKVAPQHPHTLTAQAEALLQRTIFNGNIRELRNILERAVLLSRTAVIDEKLLMSCPDSPDDGLTAGHTAATLSPITSASLCARFTANCVEYGRHGPCQRTKERLQPLS